jgi:predicted aconitase
MRILAACRAMGGLPTCTCNPFALGIAPTRGESVAWNESATAPYINGVLGARTNREGATALASALTGYTAAYGMHLEAPRRARVIVDVAADLHGSDRFALLGGAVAAACGERIPVLEGIARMPSLDELTAFCAALAAVGPLAMFHVAGLTPEAPTMSAALAGAEAPRVRIDDVALAREAARYTNATDQRVDTVVIGCPHASLAQLREVDAHLAAQAVHAGTSFILQTSAAIAETARAEGVAQRLARAGVALTRDTCVHVAYRQPAPGTTLVTDALKIAYLMKSHGLPVRLGSTAQCVRAAVTGAWAA